MVYAFLPVHELCRAQHRGSRLREHHELLDNFLAEANTGEGLKFPRWARGYLTYVLPVLIAVILIGGWIPVVQTWLGLA